MATIATIGPAGSHAWQAARQYDPTAQLLLLPNYADVLAALTDGQATCALLPAHNTREGRNRDFFRLLGHSQRVHWQDNVTIPVHLSLGSPANDDPIITVVGRPHFLRQCEEYLAARYPAADLLATHDLDRTINGLQGAGRTDFGLIEAEEAIHHYGLMLREREISPHNLTRFAVLGDHLPPASGYDATAVITRPLKDRVGLLYAMLGEFARRGINLLDMDSEIDPQSRKLSFFIEMEGHAQTPEIREALRHVEEEVIQEPGSIRILGTFPRVDIRTKIIKRCGFIGSGEMSQWFARRLTGEGYEVMLSGRSSELRPEEMIPLVDLVAICVPISATAAAIRQYGPLLQKNQALILLAGEAEVSLATALESTGPEVEVMLVHNLWGPKAASMKDKNVSLVRTPRSGLLCREFEAFLYKHGAVISQDTAPRHNLLMGVSQKLPSATAMALALTLRQHDLPLDEIERHATLTSAYSMLAMARIHYQNPRTYAEILACPGEGRRVVRDFAANLVRVLDLAEAENIPELCRLIEENRAALGEDFLHPTMEQALAVDSVLNSRRP
ncbi:prephenate dehydratase domain-containing protein [Desulfurivibrio dismutans]|uniref:prephenate dehydratase domain-containing protein n=1 Tax=Desulfurivibrio dismutans TaxID=1398908 RepID=UPI0023DAB04F|nr:prephenate dehydratase domain-containing protein [Desulfurivibrio alkaliphilus]MDF1614609.1 prephenate dehydrogenase/arogenate dehydrogenase family protein [Desulfurivibrio alkaliphilus]